MSALGSSGLATGRRVGVPRQRAATAARERRRHALARVRRPMSGEPWLILPTYNEAENVEPIVAAAAEVLARAGGDGYRVLIVDDGSPDGTGQIADRLARERDWL